MCVCITKTLLHYTPRDATGAVDVVVCLPSTATVYIIFIVRPSNYSNGVSLRGPGGGGTLSNTALHATHH